MRLETFDIKRNRTYLGFLKLFFHALIITGSFLTSQLTFADRFSAPDINAGTAIFENRFGQQNFNVDFLVADILNKVRVAVREGTDGTDNIFTNTPLSNSVVVPPGTEADTIIILNLNNGDSISIGDR